MKKLVLVAACLLSSSAMAAPSLSGNYTMLYTQICQTVLDVDKATGAVTVDKLSTGSYTAVTPEVISFSPSAGTYTETGEVDAVSTVLVKYSDGTKKGDAGKSYAFEGSGSYSNDATTFTLDGAVYDAVYSNVDQNNIAHGFMITLHLPVNKHYAADHCVATGVAQSQ